MNKITLANEYDHDFSGNKLDEENICIKNDIIYNYEDDHLKLNLIKIEDSFEYEEEEKTESFDFEFICYNLNINNKNNNNELLGDCESNCHIFSDSSTIRCFFYKGNFLINVKYIIDSSEIIKNNKLNIIEKPEKLFYYETNINIKNLKFSVAKNNNFFVCYYLNEQLKNKQISLIEHLFSSKEYISCDIFYSFDNYTEISCINFDNCENYKTFYFDEKDEFVLICKFSKKFVLSIIKSRFFKK